MKYRYIRNIIDGLAPRIEATKKFVFWKYDKMYMHLVGVQNIAMLGIDTPT